MSRGLLLRILAPLASATALSFSFPAAADSESGGTQIAQGIESQEAKPSSDGVGGFLRRIFGGSTGNDPAATNTDSNESIVFAYIESEWWDPKAWPMVVVGFLKSDDVFELGAGTDYTPPGVMRYELLARGSGSSEIKKGLMRMRRFGRGALFYATGLPPGSFKLTSVTWNWRSSTTTSTTTVQPSFPPFELGKSSVYYLGAYQFIYQMPKEVLSTVVEGRTLKIYESRAQLFANPQITIQRHPSTSLEKELLNDLLTRETRWRTEISARLSEIAIQEKAGTVSTSDRVVSTPGEERRASQPGSDQPKSQMPRTPQELAAMFNRGDKAELDQFTQQLKQGGRTSSDQAAARPDAAPASARDLNTGGDATPRAQAPGPAAASAQGFPSRPITLVVPFAPGGTTDDAARTVARELSAKRAWTIVVNNRPGAFGAEGAQHVAKANPDGHVLLLIGTGFMAVAPASDTLKDLVQIALVAHQPYALVVTANSTARSVRDLVQNSQQTAVKFAVTGAPEAELMTRLLAQKAGIQLAEVPYKGSGPAIADLVRGRVEAMLAPWAVVSAPVSRGELRTLGMALPKRFSGATSIPTLTEAGIAELGFVPGLAIFAPSQTPKDVVSHLEREIRAASDSADVRSRLLSQGLEPAGTSAQLAASPSAGERQSSGGWPAFQMPRTPQEMAAMFNRGNKEELDQFTQRFKSEGQTPPEPRPALPPSEPTRSAASPPPAGSADDDFRKRRVAAAQAASPTPGASSAKDLHARGLEYAGAGQFDKAIQEFTKAIAVDPNYGRAYMNRGVAYAKSGDSDRAAADFTHCCNIGLQEGCKASIQWVTGGQMGGALQFSRD